VLISLLTEFVLRWISLLDIDGADSLELEPLAANWLLFELIGKLLWILASISYIT
jgi:hypothetical protein